MARIFLNRGAACPFGEDKIRSLTRGTSQANPADVLIRLNQIVHGWTNYFRHAVAKHTFRMLGIFLWRRVTMWFKTLHRWSWKDIRKRRLGPHGSWLPITVDGVELINPARTPAITRYRYRSDTISTPWAIA